MTGCVFVVVVVVAVVVVVVADRMFCVKHAGPELRNCALYISLHKSSVIQAKSV